MKNYIPKGSTLDFSAMKKIKKYDDGTVVVKCSHFIKVQKNPLVTGLLRRFSTT